jgi:REP element-mobilizing transposase RayT
MIRGIESRSIFLGDHDRIDFLERLDALIPELGFRCFGWVLMPNHVHLAVQSGSIRISRLMARLNTGYARTFNLRHRRQGYLFQNRFRSRIIESHADLLSVIAYICRNPLKAGIVSSIDELSDWPWSGFSALARTRGARPFEAVSATLAMFGEPPALARCKLSQLIAEVDTEFAESSGADPPSASHGASSAGDQALDQRIDNPTSSRPARETSDAQLQELIESVCDQLRVNLSDLRSHRRSNPVARARAIIAYLAVVERHIPGQQVAKALGVSPSAISHALTRGQIAHLKPPTEPL